jgi:hypothetical protein
MAPHQFRSSHTASPSCLDNVKHQPATSGNQGKATVRRSDDAARRVAKLACGYVGTPNDDPYGTDIDEAARPRLVGPHLPFQLNS